VKLRSQVESSRRPLVGGAHEHHPRRICYCGNTWRGNVRELERALERAHALARSDRIGVDDVPPGLGATPPTVQTVDDPGHANRNSAP